MVTGSSPSKTALGLSTCTCDELLPLLSAVMKNHEAALVVLVVDTCIHVYLEAWWSQVFQVLRNL